MRNTGKTLVAEYPSGSFLTAGYKSYQLKQFHFHVPGEHRVQGQTFAMEIHLVHQNALGEMLVVGVLVRQGSTNTVLEPLWQQLPCKQGDIGPQVLFNAARLLPPIQTSYHYMGSLTTPPYTEGVRWFVLAYPIAVSVEQIHAFTELIPHNNRPIQPLNGRNVWCNS